MALRRALLVSRILQSSNSSTTTINNTTSSSNPASKLRTYCPSFHASNTSITSTTRSPSIVARCFSSSAQETRSTKPSRPAPIPIAAPASRPRAPQHPTSELVLPARPKSRAKKDEVTFLPFAALIAICTCFYILLVNRRASSGEAPRKDKKFSSTFSF